MKVENTNYSLRLPASLMGELRNTARYDGVSINQFICLAVAEKVSALRTAKFFQEKIERADVERAKLILEKSGIETPRDGDEIM